MDEYINPANLFKIMGDPVRLQIIDMLSCGELCACDILDNLSITQPTLSHHMKLLIKAGLINVERRATWAFYSINQSTIESLHIILNDLSSTDDSCICHRSASDCNCADNSRNKKERV